MSLLFFALFCNDLKSIFSWIDFDFIWTFGRNLQIFKISGFLSVLDAFQVYGQPVSCGCPTFFIFDLFWQKVFQVSIILCNAGFIRKQLIHPKSASRLIK